MFIPHGQQNLNRQVRLLREINTNTGLFTKGHVFRVTFCDRRGICPLVTINLIDEDDNKLDSYIGGSFQEGVHFEFF